jgi:hypothetical protein
MPGQAEQRIDATETKSSGNAIDDDISPYRAMKSSPMRNGQKNEE